jgi:hypothetical protein
MTNKRNNYRSKLERVNGKYLQDQKAVFEYEPKEGKIQYIIPASKHTYTPDFWIQRPDGHIFVVETKGIWDHEDRLKHAWIKKLYPTLDIRFVFQRSANPTSKGAKQTYADICEGRGRGIFRGLTWQYADKKVPQEWLV